MEVMTLKSKINRATVTGAKLDYLGSITIDREILRAAQLYANEQVHVVNTANGKRFTTYVTEGAPGSGVVCLSGADARLAQTGDLVTILAYGILSLEELSSFDPKLIFVDGANRLVEVGG